MKQVLEKLWNGTLSPNERSGANDPEVAELFRLVAENRKALEQGLDSKQRIDLDKLMTCNEEYIYLSQVHAFGCGFSVASRLLTEAFQGEI